MVSLIRAMQQRGFATPCLVVSNRPDAAGLAKAQELGVPSVSYDTDFEHMAHLALTQAKADVLCLAGFMRVLSAGFLDAFKRPVLNIHPSLLPDFKGLNTHQRALDAGVREHGCSVHLVTPKLDDGPILGQTRVPVLAGDSAKTLAARVLVEEHKLYPQVLEQFVKPQ